MNRRLFLASAAGGAAALTLSPFGAIAAHADPTPGLPNEVSRMGNLTTTSGGRTPYDNIEVEIGGDLARIYVPHSIKPGQETPVGAVWFNHGAGSTHDVMNTGYRYPASLVVDNGAIAIGIAAGGNTYSNAYAQQAQRNAWRYLSSVFPVRMNFVVGSSAGGALASYSIGRELMPYIRGLYMVNAVYDTEWGFRRDIQNRTGIRGAFDNDRDLARKHNPANIPEAAWAGANVKVVVSEQDHVVVPEDNGLALIDHIKDVANEALVEYHPLGHNVPGDVHQDMIATFARWSGR